MYLYLCHLVKSVCLNIDISYNVFKRGYINNFPVAFQSVTVAVVNLLCNTVQCWQVFTEEKKHNKKLIKKIESPKPNHIYFKIYLQLSKRLWLNTRPQLRVSRRWWWILYITLHQREYTIIPVLALFLLFIFPITSEMFLSVSFLFSSIFLSMPTIPTARVFPAYMTTKEKKKHTIKLNTGNMSQRTRKDKNKQKKPKRELFMSVVVMVHKWILLTIILFNKKLSNLLFGDTWPNASGMTSCTNFCETLNLIWCI